jgi:hypothetical protein
MDRNAWPTSHRNARPTSSESAVEELSRDERPRGSLFIKEIEALYDQPEFPKAA